MWTDLFVKLAHGKIFFELCGFKKQMRQYSAINFRLKSQNASGAKMPTLDVTHGSDTQIW